MAYIRSVSVAHDLHPSKTGAQNSDAWDALVASLPDFAGRRVEFAPGTYSFARAMEVLHPLEIIGAGGGPFYPSVKFLFAAGVRGIVLHGPFTYNGTGTKRADGALVRGIWVASDAKTGGVRHGITVWAPAHIENCLVSGWSGDGINMRASILGDGSNSSLASVKNTWINTCGITRAVASAVMDGDDLVVNTTAAHELVVGDIVWLHRGLAEPNPYFQQRTVASVTDTDTFRVTNWVDDNYSGAAWDNFIPTEVRTGNGLIIQGGDANSARIEGLSTVNNHVWGVADHSFLGNTHIGHHADGIMGIGAFTNPLVNTSYSLWAGCYSEQGQLQSFFQSPCVVIGGDHGTAINGTAAVISSTYENMRVNVRDLAGADKGSVVVGARGNNPLHMSFYMPGGTYPFGWIWDYAAAQIGWDNTLALWNVGNLANAGQLITELRTVWPNGRTATIDNAGKPVFPYGFYWNSGAGWSEGTAAPVAGEWKRGDRVWNSLPAVGSPEYWVCTVSGTPGTWVAGPNL